MTDQPFSASQTIAVAQVVRADQALRLGISAAPSWLEEASHLAAQGAAAYLAELGRELPAAFRRHAWLIALICVYAVVGEAVSIHLQAATAFSFDLYFMTYITILPITLAAILAGHLLCIAVAVRPKRPFALLLSDLRHRLASPRQVANALPCLIFIPIFGGTYTVIKSAIPLLNPYSWDRTLERADRWLHGGVAPWEWLQPVLGYPSVTNAIALLYNLWFLILCYVWVSQCFSQRDPQLRMQFLASLLLVWIGIGSGMALWLSSAGPCYFGRIAGGADPYQPLMAYLHRVNETYRIYELDAQQMLWRAYSMGRLNPGGGISAMPSMHVANALLFALLGWRTARWLGIALTGFFVVVLVGSVHLGWHYALDGYVAAACTAAIWWATGRVVRRVMPSPRDPALENPVPARAG